MQSPTLADEMGAELKLLCKDPPDVKEANKSKMLGGNV